MRSQGPGQGEAMRNARDNYLRVLCVRIVEESTHESRLAALRIIKEVSFVTSCVKVG